MKLPEKINLADKFARFSDHLSPKIVAALEAAPQEEGGDQPH